MFTTLLDYLFPRRSLLGKEGVEVTEEEEHMLTVHPYTEWQEDLRARGLSSLDHLVAACPYREYTLLRQAIHALKYRRVRALIPSFARMIALSTYEVGRSRDGILCPVPLHWARRFARGFNQAELLARSVSALTGIPVLPLLSRTRATGHQAWRSKAERLHALDSSFVARGEFFPKRVILIDDLCTTGATLDECARTLKRNGVEWVEAWVIAQG